MERYTKTNCSADCMWSLVERLYPIHRTLVNDGFKKSLEIIKEEIDINILEYDSGSPLYLFFSISLFSMI